MASRAHTLGGPSRLPLAAVLASIPSYPRPVIERLVAKMIDHLDEKDSPAEDLEDDDSSEEDSEDCSSFEDEPLFDRAQCKRLSRMSGDGAGCTVSDTDYCLGHDDRGTAGWLSTSQRREIKRLKASLRQAVDPPSALDCTRPLLKS